MDELVGEIKLLLTLNTVLIFILCGVIIFLNYSYDKKLKTEKRQNYILRNKIIEMSADISLMKKTIEEEK